MGIIELLSLHGIKKNNKGWDHMHPVFVHLRVAQARRKTETKLKLFV